MGADAARYPNAHGAGPLRGGRNLGRRRPAGRMGLERLTVEEIRRACSGRAYARGASHYRSGRVASARLVGGAARATVKDGKVYEVEASAGRGGGGSRRPPPPSCSCTCPYSRGGACEHAVAVLLHTMDNHGEMAGRAGMGSLSTARLVRQADAKYMQKFLAKELAGNAELAWRFARGRGMPPPAGLDYRKWVRSLFGDAATTRDSVFGGYGDNYVELGDVMGVAGELESAGELAEAARAYGQIAEAADDYMHMVHAYGDYVDDARAAGEGRARCLAGAPGRRGGRRKAGGGRARGQGRGG